MRSSLGTNFGLDGSVVDCTKAVIACFAAPSFQDGSGSALWAHPDVRKIGVESSGNAATVESTERRLMPERRIFLAIRMISRSAAIRLPTTTPPGTSAPTLVL